MSDELSILERIPPSPGGDNPGTSSSGGPGGETQDIIETHGKLLSIPHRNILRTVTKACLAAGEKSNGFWLQDVILCGTPGRAREVARNITTHLKGYGRSVCLITTHDSHIHVNHDCAYAGKSCRCFWRKKISQEKGIEFRRRLQRLGGRRRIRDLALPDWQRIFLYFCTEGRQSFPPHINGQVFHIHNEIANLEKSRLERPRGKSDMALPGPERCCMERDSDDLCRLFTHGESDVSDGGCNDSNVVSSKKKRKENQDLFSKLREILFQYPVSPIINIIDHPVYTSSPLKLIRGRNCKLQDCFDLIKIIFMSWTVKDYYTNIYSKENCSGIFSAGHVSISNYYYNVEESVDILDELLHFQFDNDPEIIFEFLSSLLNILDRNIPKCNSLLVYSPPSSGKNFFFDAVMDYFLNKGQFGKANKYNNFAFQDAAQKRIILWNEPNYESSNTDMLKMILGGDAYNVNVKNKPDTAVYRTPVILLTNNRIALMSSPAFTDRIKIYTWKQAPYLKDYNKKPYPVAIYYLFAKYNLI